MYKTKSSILLVEDKSKTEKLTDGSTDESLDICRATGVCLGLLIEMTHHKLKRGLPRWTLKVGSAKREAIITLKK